MEKARLYWCRKCGESWLDEEPHHRLCKKCRAK